MLKQQPTAVLQAQRCACQMEQQPVPHLMQKQLQQARRVWALESSSCRSHLSSQQLDASLLKMPPRGKGKPGSAENRHGMVVSIPF
jgi:hypothetical protein